jgi:four helix bundle protein
MQKVNSYRDLLVWQRGIDLVEHVYQISKTFPDHERFGLTSQVRRAAVSVPSNVAEGWGLGSRKQYLHHLDMARGSLYEVETQMTIAWRLGYVDATGHETLLAQTDELGRVLFGLMRSIRAHL